MPKEGERRKGWKIKVSCNSLWRYFSQYLKKARNFLIMRKTGEGPLKLYWSSII